ncbi:MAG: beta-propeller domain-containing protein [Verrucomicrobiota bacterium]|nr:beta-propeller domain-containing protein [Verrucomicrobiota bacterium]
MAQKAETDLPHILDIRVEGESVHVTAYVPEGYQQIVLEGKPRFGQGAWVPRSVIHVQGREGEYIFQMDVSLQIEWLRIRAEREIPLASDNFSGPSEFPGPSSNSDGGLDYVYAMPGVDSPEDDVRIESIGGAGGDEEREVVESDIWRMDGDRMYFFNQYRGLQIIDITNARDPRLLGEMELPAAGEQMYMVDAGHVVLLARNNCSYWGGGAESRIVILNVSTETPVEVTSLPLRGRIQESRLVGSALYVTSQVYQQKSGKPDTWEWGTRVHSFDLSDPSNPAERDVLWVPGYQNVIQATSDYLFVATQGLGSRDHWRSRLKIVDISRPDGTMRELGEIQPAGRILDKFKIDLADNVLRVISERQGRPLITELENFDLSNPSKPYRLGSVTLGEGERLHATRFDGDKAYIVTFFQIDPLWIVDLSDPKKPAITGELEVPGWSTYIQPLGDRLLAIGIDDVDGWRVSVSLFDVGNPEQPGLLSRVPIGSSHSWSEANHDEKAFGWMEDASLILVPFQGYEESQSIAGVQLIDLENDQLIKRGLIEHGVAPRRSAMMDDVILSLSGRSLMAVDAENRDQPELLSELPLSWRVDEVFTVGDHVVELGRGDRWSGTDPVLRVANLTSDFEILSTLQLGNWPVVGTELRDGILYIAQTETTSFTGIPEPEEEEMVAPPNTLWMRALDLNHLPVLTVVDESKQNLQAPLYGSKLNALWVDEETLVWQSTQEYSFWWGGFPIMEDEGRMADVGIWPSSAGSRFLAFDTRAEHGLPLLSEYDLDVKEVWNFSEAHAVDGKIYLSYQENTFDKPALTLLPGRDPGRWMQKYFLAVIDYADTQHPTSRPPVNLPGSLVGVSHGGGVLYTQGNHYDSETLAMSRHEWLDALAYDGVAAHQVDAIAFSNTWPHLARITSDGYVVGVQLHSGDVQDGLEDVFPRYGLSSWKLSHTGEFEQRNSEWKLPYSASALHLQGNDVLVKQDRDVWSFRLGSNGALDLQSVYAPLGCYGYDLNEVVIDQEKHLWIPAMDYGTDRIPPGEPGQSIVSISTGSSFGECLGYCETSLHVEPNRLTFQARAPDQSLPTFRQSDYGNSDWNRLIPLIDWKAFLEISEKIGCPDCADGGAEWIEISVPGRTHRVTFEYGASVKEMGPILKSLRLLRSGFEIPVPQVDSIRYVRMEEDCQGLCRGEFFQDAKSSRWNYTDPEWKLRSRHYSKATGQEEWSDIQAMVDWGVIGRLSSGEFNICQSCPGVEWIEIRGLGQTFILPAGEPELIVLREKLSNNLGRYRVEPKPVPITRIDYGTSFGFCEGYCIKELAADAQGIAMVGASRQENIPNIESSLKITETEWGDLLKRAEAANIETMDPVIGCPDCADGGSAWIRVWRGEKEYQVTFEYGHPPDAIAELVAQLHAWIELLPTDAGLPRE